jgi:hypothetical protein
MLKKRLVVATLILVFLVAFTPAPSQAAPWGWTAASGPAATGFFTRIERWLSSFLNGAPQGPERPAQRQKNGCGIDPNGSPLCGTGGGAGSGLTAALPDPTDSGLN